jgi:hypothetical protein
MDAIEHCHLSIWFWGSFFFRTSRIVLTHRRIESRRIRSVPQMWKIKTKKPSDSFDYKNIRSYFQLKNCVSKSYSIGHGTCIVPIHLFCL